MCDHAPLSILVIDDDRITRGNLRIRRIDGQVFISIDDLNHPTVSRSEDIRAERLVIFQVLTISYVSFYEIVCVHLADWPRAVFCTMSVLLRISPSIENEPFAVEG